MRQYRWSDYLICLTPLPLLAYVGLDSYAIDYRAFYLAGKAALNGLDPYLNHLAISSQYYGPINAELAHYSGWKYPPLATYLFTPFAAIPYEASKNLFNLLSIALAIAAVSVAIQLSQRRLAPISILVASFSFPVLATLERGQVELLLTTLACAAVFAMAKGRTSWSAIAIGLLSALKIYPILLAAALLRSRRTKALRAMAVGTATLALVALITLIATPAPWRTTFMERLNIPFDQVPGQVLPTLPPDSGVIEGTNTVRTADARNLTHSHDFVFGFANPLLKRNTVLAGIIGLCGVFAALIANRRQAQFQQALALMPWINIANPLAWIMGLTWYIPLFLYSYTRVNGVMRFVLCLPLILPPMLNTSGYLAACSSLVIARYYQDAREPDPTPQGS